MQSRCRGGPAVARVARLVVSGDSREFPAGIELENEIECAGEVDASLRIHRNSQRYSDLFLGRQRAARMSRSHIAALRQWNSTALRR